MWYIYRYTYYIEHAKTLQQWENIHHYFSREPSLSTVKTYTFTDTQCISLPLSLNLYHLAQREIVQTCPVWLRRPGRKGIQTKSNLLYPSMFQFDTTRGFATARFSLQSFCFVNFCCVVMCSPIFLGFWFNLTPLCSSEGESFHSHSFLSSTNKGRMIFKSDVTGCWVSTLPETNSKNPCW